MPNRALTVSLLMIFLGAATLSPAQAARPKSSTPGWLGLGFVLHRDPPRKPWLHIQRVAVGGPAEQAALRPQDVVVQINGKDITFASDMAALDYFAARVAGEKIVFTVARPNGRVRLTLLATPRSPEKALVWKDNYSRAAAQDRVAPESRPPSP